MTWAVKVKQLFKHPLFISGFSFLFLLFLASVIHAIFFNGVVPETKYLYEDGVIAKKAPFSPMDISPLGTGAGGRHVMYMLLQGAKFTIGIAIAVAACRIFISLFVALFFNIFLSRFHQYVSGLLNAFYYIPAALICYVLLEHILIIGALDDDPYTFLQKVVFELVILVLIAIPGTSLLIANQVDQIYKYEFITAAKLLGGRRRHILQKHVFPHIWPRLLIQFVQEIVQVLVLLIHMGFFHLLFGGTLAMKGTGGTPDIYISLSSEWSGLVGNGFNSLEFIPWYFFSAMVAFTLVILAFNFIVRGMENVFFGFHMMRKKTNRKHGQGMSSENKSFEFIHRENRQ